MAGPDGKVPAVLVGVHDTIVASATPRKALNWLRVGAGAPILAGMARGTIDLSHEALDAQPRTRAANHVRQMLVAHGVLVPRDDQLAALERLNADTVAAIARPEDRKIVAAFASWRVLRRLRRRAEPNTVGRTAIQHARNQVVGAVRFLDWLAAHHLSLPTCTQGDLELWLATGPSSRYAVHHFVEWTSARKHSAKLTVPPLAGRPGDALDAETDGRSSAPFSATPASTSLTASRAAFVLLYAQPLSRVASHDRGPDRRQRHRHPVRFGTPRPRRHRPARHLSHHPGRDRPITPHRHRIHHPQQLAVPRTPPRTAHHRPPTRTTTPPFRHRRPRRTASRPEQLAAEVPAIVLAEMLGIATTTAVDWVHAAGGDWANYAATTPTIPIPTRPESPNRCNTQTLVAPHSTRLEYRTSPVSTQECPSAKCKSLPATLIPERQPSTTGAAKTSTSTPPMS